MKIKLNPEEAERLCYDGHEDFEIVEHGEWKVSGKYQQTDCICKQHSTGKHFSYSASRCGSEFTDWSYDYEYAGIELEEVVRKVEVVTRTIVTWEVVDG